MCGICGIITFNNNFTSSEDVKLMNKKLFHRGPDEEGFFRDDSCALAMRRLSIIDLSHGTQPIYSASKQSLIFFNGEIYNYRELRSELRLLGIVFHTESDTEVLINAYEAWGEEFISKLRGMFAFCIYDLIEHKWILARDRFGEKPLYFFYRQGYLSFSSEIESLLSDPNVPRRLNVAAVPEYLTLSYVTEPETLILDVKTLKPGHFMIFKDGNLDIKSYFEYNYRVDRSITSLQDAVEHVKPVWETAVKRQMIADVPLGAFLSGGIDSSTVVATMQKHASQPIKTFTVRFEEEAYDESPIAREVASRLGTHHHEITIKNAGFTKDLFWELISKAGIPFPDSSAIPSYYITQEIRKHVKVALSGDGGDELFAGYNLFHWYQSIIKLRSIPQGIRNFLISVLSVAQKIPVANRLSMLRQVKKAMVLSNYNLKVLPIHLHALFELNEIRKLLPGATYDFEHATKYPTQFEEWSPLRRIMHFRLIHNLPLDMLTKVDRMSMANSLEVRAPFLDADLFDVASTLPEAYLMDGNIGKIVIREMMKNELPESVFNHPKKGFSIPLHKYQNAYFWELVEELLVSNSEIHQLFEKNELMRIVKTSSGITSDNANTTVYKASHQLWSLLQLSGWIKYYKITI